ncbi:hypothetical protein PR202_gb20554 [Eleusine coracana subsp. coracana]|uniref:Isopenicillin N synthase-like Fe(2+) 2OG dioxygenase domain-containing protein n=1 Tax=Eleusine coracana subsp. coracana TaxID=191504 RepID=A0AAV5FCJ0_ELECO|nr:hypothetical protein PR202_gb20554 [Eleusine coracana subsp. coracana]
MTLLLHVNDVQGLQINKDGKWVAVEPMDGALVVNIGDVEIVEARPVLKERTTQQGDAFAVVCGDKEPRGYVRVLGLGPTPQDIVTPGLKYYAPTRLQMEIFGHKQAEREKAALEEHVDQLQARISLIEQRTQQDRASVEPNSQHGSTSIPICMQQNGDVEIDQDDEGDASDDDASRDDFDRCYFEDNQNFHSKVYGAAKSIPITRSNDTPRSEHDALVIILSF